MSITYTIKVVGLKTRTEGNFNDVVRIVDYNISGTDEGITYDVSSSFEISKEVDPNSFISLSALTEQDVLTWLEEQASNSILGIKNNIAYYINQVKASRTTTYKPLPWDPNAPVPPIV